MEKTLIVLLLLCALSSADRKPLKKEPQQCSPCLSDIHAVLRDLSSRLGKYEVKMEEQQKVIQEQAAKLKEMDTLRQQQEAQNNEMDTLKQQQRAQAAELTNINMRTNVTENHVEFLRRDRAVGQVAFSATLRPASGTVYVGPFKTYITLVFRRVISNIGNVYNPNTGLFIAPVKGAYHFEVFNGSVSYKQHISGVHLVKNGQLIVISYERGTNGHSSAANGATLFLKPGDVVSLRLYQGTSIWDSGYHHCSFSGHLLFPM